MPRHDIHDPFDHEMLTSMQAYDLGRFKREGGYVLPKRKLADQLRDHALRRIGLDPDAGRDPI